MKSMIKLPALIGSLALLTAGSASAQVVTSTFDNDLEGWNAVGFNIDESITAALSGSVLSFADNMTPIPDAVHDDGNGNGVAGFDNGGNGFARFTDAITEPGSFLQAPSQYTGDLSAFLGGTFSYEHRLFDEGEEVQDVNDPFPDIQDYFIVLISGDPNSFEAYVAVQEGPVFGDADTGWVKVEKTLNDTDFVPVDQLDLGIFGPDLAGETLSSLAAQVPSFLTPPDLSTDSTFEEVLADVTTVLISFELVDNNATQTSESAGVDNVILQPIPEPSSLALLGLGGMLVARRRRG